MAVNRTTVLVASQIQLFKVKTAIGFATENFCSTVSPKDEMLWLVGDNKSG
jgi:hypothetical protein